jgi:hypothetical protein
MQYKWAVHMSLKLRSYRLHMSLKLRSYRLHMVQQLRSNETVRWYDSCSQFLDSVMWLHHHEQACLQLQRDVSSAGDSESALCENSPKSLQQRINILLFIVTRGNRNYLSQHVAGICRPQMEETVQNKTGNCAE